MASTKHRSFALPPLALLALAACSHEIDGPTPTVQGLDPSIVCTEQLTTPVKINGDGLSPLAEEALTPDPLLALPTVKLTRTADLLGGMSAGTPITIPDDPKSPAASHVKWTSQQLLTFDVFPGLALPPGIYSVEVTNANKKTVVQAGALAAVPPPTIATVEPDPVCNAQGTSVITITGTGFLILGDTKPTVTIDGNPMMVTMVNGCVPLVGTRTPAQACTEIVISVPQNTLTIGDHELSVVNPAPAACSTMPTYTLTVVPPPDVTGVQPQVICAGGGDLVVTGTNFGPNARVIIKNATTMVEATVRTNTPTRLDVTVGMGLEPGTYDVIVDNDDGCLDTLPNALRVTPGPSVFFVDPPTVYNGISIQATIYVTGLLNAPTSVSIRPAAGGDPRALMGVTYDTAHPNRVLATVPSALAAGDYDVIVSDGSCSATLPAGLHVVGTLTVGIDSVTPPFGWRVEDTAVTINAKDPAAAGQVQFMATPRAYLNPKTGGAALARPVESVSFVNATRLTAVVGSALTAGSYDLIIVNPDRSVGLLANAFLVTADNAPPPIVDTLTPGSVVNATGQTVTVLGKNFRTPAVQATCQLDAGGMMVIDATGVTTGATSFNATFNMGMLGGPAVCVVRVTNSDMTYVDFSALTVTGSSRNVPPSVTDDDMVTPRRALAAAAGRVTSQARYVYAIGGDDGGANLLTSVEASPVSLFGALDPFFTLPAQDVLPEGRSFSGAAVIGRFIYLVGGRTSAGATTSVRRAQILDPAAAPDINDLDMEPVTTGGLDKGLYYYRVSAVMPMTDASNPGGETLASDPFGVVVPDLTSSNKKIKLTLFWEAVPGAASYKIYRTPMPGQLVGAVKQVGSVTNAVTFIDSGAAAMSGTPLPEGSLGQWKEVGPLPSAREGLGVAFAKDPDGPGDAYFLYALGGRDAAGMAQGSYTFSRIVVAADGSQTVGAFSPDATFMSTPRWQFGAIGMDNARASVVQPGDTWIYAMSGYNSGATAYVNEGSAALVGNDGTLGSINNGIASPANKAGYAFMGANNFLYTFGGGATPNVAAKSGEMCPAGTGGGCHLPGIVNFNDQGALDLKQPRYLPGAALESAFVFVLGGANSGAASASKTTERTHW